MSEIKEDNKTRGNWTPLNIISVIVGIIVFWPVGLFLLIWVLMDRDVVEIGHMIRKEWRNLVAKFSRTKSASGNRVLDEFQQTQFDRIAEIKNEIKERSKAFHAYKEERDRATEQSEFEDFMRKKPASNEGSSEDLAGKA